MFEWFKKETPKKDLESEKYEIPSFPDFPIQKGFTQAAIKDAVTNDRTLLPRISAFPKKIPEISAPLENKSLFDERSQAEIFVKIDKFHAAQKSLEDAKERIGEIEKHLKKLRETTTREEVQLSSWEREIETLKARIKEVSKNIFEKVE